MTRSQLFKASLLGMALTTVNLLPFTGAQAQDHHSASLSLELAQPNSLEGAVMVAIFQGETAWGDNQAIASQRVAVEDETPTISFTDLPPGEYGIKLFHDTNGDGSLNRGRFGIPSEPYGFSNNAPVRFGPPSWEDASFTLMTGENSHSITLTGN